MINAVPAAPAAPGIGTITQPACSTPTGSVQLTGCHQQVLDNKSGNISGTGTTYTLTGLTPGTYNFTVTIDGCTSVAADPVVINAAAAAPSAPIVGTITQTTCDATTGSVILSGLPAAGTWTIQPGNHTGSGTSATISNLAPGTYHFTVTNEAGCTSAEADPVTINPQPLITPTFTQVGPLCQTTTFPRIFARVHDAAPADNGVLMGAPWNNLTGVTTTGLKDELGNITSVGLTSILHSGVHIRVAR
ncbi:MAG: hypothetical protein WDN26_24285 [Chitinophagaceae bacterium]